jgi:hypothetical protein
MLKLIYTGVTIALSTPILGWNALVTVIMWDIKYWDNACEQVNNLIDPKL